MNRTPFSQTRHAATLWQCDFVSKPMWTVKGLVCNCPLSARGKCTAIPATRDPSCSDRLPAEGFTMDETRGSPAPPKKHRRRWLIVAAVLALVSLGTWWCWPRGDGRFVGRWQMRIAALSDQGTDIDLVVDLRSAGLVSYTEPSGRMIGPERWAVSGSVYRFGTPTADRGINEAISRLADVIPISVSCRSVEWRIESVSEQTIEMKTGIGRRVTLRRMPE
jgi:hypothetical protein